MRSTCNIERTNCVRHKTKPTYLHFSGRLVPKESYPTQTLLTLFNFLYEFSLIVKSTTCYMANLPSTLTRQGWIKEARLHGSHRTYKMAKSRGSRKSATGYIRNTYFLCPLKSTLYLVTRLVKCWGKVWLTLILLMWRIGWAHNNARK